MKRIFKLLLNLVLALLAVALTFIILFFVTPSWQQSLVEGVLARDSHRKWQVGTVKIQPMMAEVEDLFVIDGPVGAEVKILLLEGPFWKLPFTRSLEIESGSLLGLDLDVSQVAVGDLTSRDYQGFLQRVASDTDFWKERIGLVMSKFEAAGLRVSVQDMTISGRVLMPGNKVVPVRWKILTANSRSPRLTEVEPISSGASAL